MGIDLRKSAQDSVEKIDSFRGDNYFLSNMYPSEVTYNGITYKNSEAAFQAQKDPKRSREFSNLDGKTAKKKGGRRGDITPVEDWDNVKQKIMYDIVKAKFEQNPELLSKLKDTGSAILEEGNDWNDKEWGTVNGEGKNLLGKILMQVREDLNN